MKQGDFSANKYRLSRVLAYDGGTEAAIADMFAVAIWRIERRNCDGPSARGIISKNMKVNITLALASLAILLTSCATPRPRPAFHNTDNSAVVIESLDPNTGQMILPTASVKQGNDQVLAAAMGLRRHQTAVIILENYNEPRIGGEFRIRGTPWFVGLRVLGYQRIVFLQGNGTANPEGLPTLVEYD